MVTRSEHAVQITQRGLVLDGILGVPPDSSGVIIFAHGSGSGRLSPRNNFVARFLQTTRTGNSTFRSVNARRSRGPAEGV